MKVVRVGVSPVKGMRHEALDEVELRRDGVTGDRVFALVDPVRHRVLRTVEEPGLLTLRARWRDGVLRVEFPDGAVVEDRPVPDGDAAGFEYWGRRPHLTVQRTTLAGSLSDHLGRRVRLARITAPGDVVYGAPVTVVTTSDVTELAARASTPGLVAETARFRATAVVDDTGEALAPDSTGRRLRVGAALVEITGPIPRCAVIDRDPVTGESDGRLLGTLATYRRSAGEVWFGHYARVVAPGRCSAGVPAGVSP